MRSIHYSAAAVILVVAAVTLVGCAGGPAPAPVTPGSVADQPNGSGTGCPPGSIQALSAWEDATAKSLAAAVPGSSGSASAIQEPVASSVFKPIASALSGACVWHILSTGTLTFAGMTSTTTELYDEALIQSSNPTTTAQAILAAAKKAGLPTVSSSGAVAGVFSLTSEPATCAVQVVTSQVADPSARWLIDNQLKTVGTSKWVNVSCQMPTSD